MENPTQSQQHNLTHRHRVNFSMTSKGVISCDVTYEATGKNRQDVILEAGMLLDDAMIVCSKRNRARGLNP